MCDQLGKIREAMGTFSAAFDAALFSVADARMVLRDVTAIEHMAVTVKALAAARICNGDQRPGAQRLAAEQLAELTGTTLGAANDTIAVGRRLQVQPEVAAAARAGELSGPQLIAVTDGVAANSDAEGRLLGKAATGSLADLRDESARVKAAAQPDPDRRRAEIRAARRFNSWTDQGGVGHIGASGNVEDIAQITAAVRALADDIFHDARRNGQREPSRAYEFDALVRMAMWTTSPADRSGHAAETEMGLVPSDDGKPPRRNGAAPTSNGGSLSSDLWDPCSSSPDVESAMRDVAGGRTSSSTDQWSPAGANVDHAAASAGHRGGGRQTTGASDAPPGSNRPGRRQRRGAQVKLLLRVDLDSFLRGYPVDGEMCEIVGCGPVPMAAVHDLLEKGDPLVAAILTRGKTVFGVAHLRRQATAHQRTALEWLYPSCNVQGCNCRAHLEIDHRIDWAEGRYTALDILDCLCRFHHAKKTRDGWALVEGAGKRAFVPPEDQRHPRYSRAPRSGQ